MKWLVVAAMLVVAGSARAQDDCQAKLSRYQGAISALERNLTATLPAAGQSMPLASCERLRAILKPVVGALGQLRDCSDYDDMRLRVAEFIMMEHTCSPASLQ